MNGLYTALLTPFHADAQKIDYESLKKLIENQISNGVDGVVVCGSTGEAGTLSMDEHYQLMEKSFAIVDKRIKILAGTGSNSTATAIALSKFADRLGMDGLLVVNPYYNKPTQEGLYRHFTSIADQVDTPIILYNIPQRTSINVSVDTLVRLAKHPNIAGIKEASGNFQEIIEKKHQCSPDFVFLCGDDNVLPAFIGLGGQGLISVISNLYPKKIKMLLQYYLQGDFTNGNRLFYQLVELMNFLFIETNPIPVKAAASHLGICKDMLRLPLLPLGKENREKLLQILAKVNLK